MTNVPSEILDQTLAQLLSKQKKVYVLIGDCGTQIPIMYIYSSEKIANNWHKRFCDQEDELYTNNVIWFLYEFEIDGKGRKIKLKKEK